MSLYRETGWLKKQTEKARDEVSGWPNPKPAAPKSHIYSLGYRNGVEDTKTQIREHLRNVQSEISKKSMEDILRTISNRS
jgi:hypothetical protein